MIHNLEKMAKINHNNYLDVVDTIFSSSKLKGLTHIHSDEKYFDGKEFTIRGKQLKNFGTCGYLGLENHPLLVEGSIDLLRKYGTQFSMGRIFMRPTYIRELEELMGAVFDNNKVLCYTSTSTAHISVIGTIIKPDDLIVLDQQVHFSVQFPCKNTKLQGTEIKMVRHSNFDMLEDILKEDSNKYNRIWYMADGVYSMHGDFPDTDRLKTLLDKYPKLHLYFDDAHGMGWSGKNGAGYVFDRLGVSKRIIVISTLAKGFGCVGGTAVFSDEEMYKRVDIFGGPHSYSHPLTPASAGAAIASAKIHLSNEIYQYQDELYDLTSYMDKLLLEKNLPNISAPNSPIYFIGGGLNKVTHNFVNRILDEGFYVNTATFPAVPNDKSGLRFTVTRHVTKEDISAFVDAMTYHFPKAIEEENDKIERVYEDFNIPYLGDVKQKIEQQKTLLKVEKYTTIHDVDKELWDSVFRDRGNYTHSGLMCMEEIFSDNEKPEENWSFHYLIIKDENDNLVLATFFTGGIYKDDMLSLENVSRKIEEARINDPYYLCSKTLAMGAMFAEGDFIYLSDDEKKINEAISFMFNFVKEIKERIDATTVIFRDFEEGHILCQILEDEGYAQIKMPNTNILKNPKWNSADELLALIPSKKRRDNIKQYAIRHVDKFEIIVKKEITDEEAELFFKLFFDVKSKNFGLNFFNYPSKITKILSNYSDWEFVIIKLKETGEIISNVWSFIGENHYIPFIIGLNYNFSRDYRIYQQSMYQVIKRGNDLDKNTIYLGLSADFEKYKYGAVQIKKSAFIKVDDTYSLEIINSYSNI